ncbi:hypothetical protein ACJX0J_022910, partial [Zea mays]
IFFDSNISTKKLITRSLNVFVAHPVLISLHANLFLMFMAMQNEVSDIFVLASSILDSSTEIFAQTAQWMMHNISPSGDTFTFILSSSAFHLVIGTLLVNQVN